MHFSKTGKMSSFALGNRHLSVKNPSDSGVVYCGVWTLCQPMVILQVTGKLMPAVTVSRPILLVKVTLIVTVIKVVKLYVCFMLNPTLEMVFF